MHVIAVNGSPRRNYNTAGLLKRALDGAISEGATTELIHLYELRYQGCTSCFTCKRRDYLEPGHCVLRDDLTSVLERIYRCDALLVGSPIYFNDVTGATRSFMERLLFPNVNYDQLRHPLFTGHIDTCFIYTMNLPSRGEKYYRPVFESNSQSLQLLGGSCEYLASYDTYQFDDYEHYNARLFDVAEKERIRREQFPKDCAQAFEIGARLASLKR